jgi:hypothetical protein
LPAAQFGQTRPGDQSEAPRPDAGAERMTTFQYLDKLIKNRMDAIPSEKKRHAWRMSQLEQQVRSLQALKRTIQGANVLQIDDEHLYRLLTDQIGPIELDDD